MKCDDAIERFLQREDYHIPLEIRLHILFCPLCRMEINRLRDFFISLRDYAPYSIKEDLTDSVMRFIQEDDVDSVQHISSRTWLIAGFVLLASNFIIQYSDSLRWLKTHFGRDLEIPLHIIMGLMISVYAVIFIGTHLEELKRYIRTWSVKDYW
jgi:hypothetical protein